MRLSLSDWVSRFNDGKRTKKFEASIQRLTQKASQERRGFTVISCNSKDRQQMWLKEQLKQTFQQEWHLELRKLPIQHLQF